MKVVKSEDNLLEFDNGVAICGIGDKDCCAVNYLDFEQLPVGTEVETATLGELVDKLKMQDDGFAITDINGLPKWVQARSDQNGYYSSMTDVQIKNNEKTVTIGRLSGEVGY